VEGDGDLYRLNAVVFAGYMLVAIPLGILWGRSLVAPIEQWLADDRPPTPPEVAHTLRFPLSGFKAMGTLWGGAALLFAILNSFSSVAFALLQGLTITLGGAITSTLIVVAGERTYRDVIGAALSSGVPKDPVGPGIGVRMVLVWGLTSGIPLFGLLLLSVGILFDVDASPGRLAATAGFLSGLGLTVGLFGMLLVGRSVADPVEDVRAALGAVERGDLEAQARVTDGSEVGLLVAGFNQMVAGLRERERVSDLFGRHVGKDVALAAVHRDTTLGGEVREVGILFVDLTGSTSFSASRSPNDVVALLNAFFGIVVEAADRNGGWVNKFQGDAALCVFGAPTTRDDAAGDALRAARDLHAHLAEELGVVDAGIGVSAGPAVAGNVGAEQRFEYTVIGDPVNEAARLCELAKHRPERVLTCEGALLRAGSDEARHWTLADAVVLRGRPTPTRVATTAL
ncbi:MAG: adenylate/guanylate cyclase domain-containing protein, partial [Actinomycetota bacterium]|nr:adenylate/guanylate cyclase domain-containing protein [Actinomycetota bacterium]